MKANWSKMRQDYRKSTIRPTFVQFTSRQKAITTLDGIPNFSLTSNNVVKELPIKQDLVLRFYRCCLASMNTVVTRKMALY